MIYDAINEEVTRMGFIHAYARPYLTVLATGLGMMITRENIQFHNSLQVGFAERFVYSSTDDFDDAKKMLENSPRMRKGPKNGRPNRRG